MSTIWECSKCKQRVSYSQTYSACRNCGFGCFAAVPDEKPTAKESPGGAVRADAGKLDWDLMPWAQLEEVVRVLMGDGPDKGGAAQYGRWNWQKGAGDPDFQLRTRNSLTRHVVAYLKGECKDPVTGLHPLAHAVCNCLFLMYYDGVGRRPNED